MNYLRKHAEQYYNNGYRIVPIGKGKKFPASSKPRGNKNRIDCTNWQHFIGNPNNIKKWWKDETLTGIGLLCEYVIGVDIDSKDPYILSRVHDKLAEIVGSSDFIKRAGDAPKLLIPFRIENKDSKFHKIQSAVYLDEFGIEHKLEILGKGNQFVCEHIHPTTKKPYTYLTDKTFLNTKYSDLLTMNAVQSKQLTDWFEKELMQEVGWVKKTNSTTAYKGKLNATTDDPLDNIVAPLDISDAKVVRTLEAIDPDCEYETWYKVGMALWHQYTGSDLGFEMYKTWSLMSDNPKHKGNVSKEKWKSFKEDVNYTRPITFAYCLAMSSGKQGLHEIQELRELIPIAHEEEEDIEEDENIGEFVRPKLGSKERKKLDEYVDRYVLVGHGKRVIDKTKPISFTPFELDDFHQYVGNEMIKIHKPIKTDPFNTVWRELSRLWVKSVDMQKVLDTRYAPGEKRIFKDDSGTKYANVFHFPDHRKNAKKAKIRYDGRERIDVFLNHIRYLFPIKEERDWFLKWIAYIIQQPQERCPIMPIHVAKIQGTGRSWVLRVLQELVGAWNVNTPDVEQLIGERSNFNDHLVDCKIIACEELRIDGKDRYKVENILKSDITDVTKFIRRKFGTQGTERLYGCFLGWTNYADAIQISPDDRRHNVFSGPTFKNTPEHYDSLLNWIDQKNTGIVEVGANIAQLFSYFESMDISTFNMSNPMDTPARRTMMSMSKSDVEEMYDNFVQQTEHNVLTNVDVKNEIVNLEGIGHDSDIVDVKKVSAILRHKATSIGRVRAHGKQHRVWAINNEQYSKQEATALYEKYMTVRTEEDFIDV